MVKCIYSLTWEAESFQPLPLPPSPLISLSLWMNLCAYMQVTMVHIWRKKDFSSISKFGMDFHDHGVANAYECSATLAFSNLL